MKQYDSYKDSGVEWIGKIPSHWEVVPLKRKMRIIRGGSPRPIEKYLSNNGYNWIKIGDTIKGDKYIRSTSQKIKTEGLSATRLVRRGDLILSNSMSFGEPYIIELEEGCIHDGWLSLSHLNDVDKEFLYYTLLSDLCKKQFESSVDGGVVKNLNIDKAGYAIIFIPPISEQRSLVSYLDEKCGKIDKAIATQEKRVELLKELRQNIITQAVTCGINPDAPLKDSGVEWIGEVPEHWKVCRIKNVLKQGADSIKIGPFGSSLTGKVGADLEYKVYGQWNIVGADFNAGTNTVNKETFDELSKSYKVISGDILVSMMGTIGKCAVIPEGIQEGIMDSHVVKIRLNDSIMIGSYFEYIYDKDKSNVIFNQLQKMKGGSIMDGLNSTIIKSLTILVPPLSEQQEIVSYIESQTARLDKSIEKAEHQIELLQELKQSIITEVVTGKRKVD